MKTNKYTKNENVRSNSIIRIFVLLVLSGVATLNSLKAGDPEIKGITVNFRFDLLKYRLQLALEEEPEPEMEIEDWMLDLSYWNKLIKDKSVVVKNDNAKPDAVSGSNLSEHRISIALQEEPEPEMEIEDWMLDIDGFIQHINFAKK